MANRIQVRRDSASAWTSADPTLASGEIGFERDTGKFKIGDGATTWTSLSYSTASGSSWGNITGTLSDQSDLQIALDGKQPIDTDLTAIAALTTTSFGRSLLTQADASAALSTLGAGTSNFDGAFSSLTGTPTTLAGYGITDGVAAVTSVDNMLPRFNGTGGQLQQSALTLADASGNNVTLSPVTDTALTIATLDNNRNITLAPHGTGIVSIPGSVAVADLSFTGTTTSGLRLKSLTTTQKNALTPVEGDMVYDSTLGRFQAYEGAAWHSRVRLDGDTMTGNLLFTDNTYDIGAFGATRPRTLYLGTSVVVGNSQLTGSQLRLASDVFITYRATATVQLGGGDSATPVAQTLAVQGARGGTDTNVRGGNLTIQSGLGTGSATGSTITFKTSPATTSGTTQQTATTALTLNADQSATFAGDIVTSAHTVFVGRNGIGVSSNDAFIAQNSTAAANGAQQYSPRTRWTGQGWKTDATAASQTVNAIAELRPVQGTAAPTGIWALAFDVNGGGYADKLTVSSAGDVVAGSVTTGAPTTGTAAAWKLGSKISTGTSVLDATGYVELDIGGTLYKLGLVTNS